MILPTLILIDIQQGFSEPSWGERSTPQFEVAVARLLAAWRQAGAPLIHVRHDSREPASPLRPGQSGNALMPCAAPYPGEKVVAKQVNSAFIGTQLQAMLDGAKATDLVIAGLCTDHCVSTTIRMAANLGYRTTVASDATATFPRYDMDGNCYGQDLVHRVSLASLATEFAAVLPTADIISTSLTEFPCGSSSPSLPHSFAL